MEVTGVGGVQVYPLDQGAHTVGVVLVDQFGEPASEELVEQVQTHIDPDSKGIGEGEAPIGAYCYVSAAVEQAVEALKAAGVRRCVMLNVSGPFHSPMMIPAGEALDQEMADMQWSELKIPYVTNVTAEYVTDIHETRALLAKQVASSVRWQASMERMIADGVDTFVEIGPGKTLAGFMRKINRNAKVYTVNTVDDAQKVIGELRQLII